MILYVFRQIHMCLCIHTRTNYIYIYIYRCTCITYFFVDIIKSTCTCMYTGIYSITKTVTKIQAHPATH